MERSETQQRVDNVGFRPSTQPTPALVFMLNSNGIVLYAVINIRNKFIVKINNHEIPLKIEYYE